MCFSLLRPLPDFSLVALPQKSTLRGSSTQGAGVMPSAPMRLSALARRRLYNPRARRRVSPFPSCARFALALSPSFFLPILPLFLLHPIIILDCVMYSTTLLLALLAVAAGRSGAAPVPNDGMVITESAGPFGGGHGPQIVNKGPIFAPPEYLPAPSSSSNTGYASASHGAHASGTTCRWTCASEDQRGNALKSLRGPFATTGTFTCTYRGGEVCTYDGVRGLHICDQHIALTCVSTVHWRSRALVEPLPVAH